MQLQDLKEVVAYALAMALVALVKQWKDSTEAAVKAAALEKGLSAIQKVARTSVLAYEQQVLRALRRAGSVTSVDNADALRTVVSAVEDAAQPAIAQLMKAGLTRATIAGYITEAVEAEVFAAKKGRRDDA